MQSIPSNATRYLHTEEYSAESVGEDFWSEQHRTQVGVWCRIVVLEGKMKYRILEPNLEEHVLSPELDGVVEPTVLHEVEPLGRVRFYVEFFRQ